MAANQTHRIRHVSLATGLLVVSWIVPAPSAASFSAASFSAASFSAPRPGKLTAAGESGSMWIMPPADSLVLVSDPLDPEVPRDPLVPDGSETLQAPGNARESLIPEGARESLRPVTIGSPTARVPLVAPQSVSDGEGEGEPLPPPRQRLQFADPRDDSNIKMQSQDDRITVTAVDASLEAVLAMIAQQHQLNIVSGELQGERISVTLQNVQIEEALNAILAVKGLTWARHGNIVTISSLSGDKQAASVQGREVRVYNLNYVMAADVQTIVAGLLSPVGQVFITKTNTAEQRQTHEQLVVEDLPEYLRHIEAFLTQADTAPRQVLVEAHVLQVALANDLRHGVNLEHLLSISNSDITLQTAGFASDTSPATLLRLDGPDLKGLLEAIRTTTDAKTLATPKVAVVNGQQARMQVGGKIGYRGQTTATQTSTTQSVEFLEVGVILTVTPIITDDGQVLMKIMPQVSTGTINPTTQMPETNTTEVETTVMLGDGEALLIGGLIQEEDNDSQNKIPVLGDIPGIGRLFQRRSRERRRNEIIIAVMPRVISEVPGQRCIEPCKVIQATTPLVSGSLESIDRRHWEPRLPDAAWPAQPGVPRTISGASRWRSEAAPVMPVIPQPPAEDYYRAQ